MKKRRRGLVVAAIVVVSLAVVVLGLWVRVTQQAWPKTRGTVTAAGLSGPVEVVRDRYGVPHIYARTAEDLFFAQGWVHAQDRFWQMEFWRRISAGRLSELFGKATLTTDVFMRTLGLRRVAQEEYELLTAEEKRYFDAYAAGVNGYILHRPPAKLGLEFALLQLQGVKVEVEPWTPVDSISWGKVMAYDLGGNYDAEKLNLDVLRVVGSRTWLSFVPPYRADMPYAVNEQELTQMLGNLLGMGGSPPGLSSTGRTGVGSNNWVVAGSRTKSGKPMLANDMHLGIQMPSIWYEVGLHGLADDGTAGRTAACPFNVRGFSFPGVPGVIAGNNDRIAWGLTNLTTDTQDIYVEKINPENTDQYEVNGRWVDMDVRAEVIRVRKAEEPTVIRVRTTRHGPVVSDVAFLAGLGSYSVTAGREFPDGVGLTAASLKWTALEPGRLVKAVLGIDKSSNYREFRAAVSMWDSAAQNVIYADVDGHIGYQATGRQPIRAKGRGVGPVPGWTDEFEWKGYILFEQLPYLYDPAKGYVVTANAAIAAPSYPYFLSADFANGERASRIEQLILQDTDGLTVEDMQAIQRDVWDRNAAETVPYLRGIDLAAGMRPWDEPAPGVAGQEDQSPLPAARDRLVAWDAQLCTDSPEAALYGYFWTALVEQTFRDQYPQDHWPPDWAGRFDSVLHAILEKPQDPWWDDARTPGVKEGRDDILARALRLGYEAGANELGKDIDRWQWGKVHIAEFRNQTLGESGIGPIEALFNRGPFPVPGGTTTVAVSAWDMADPFAVNHIASERLVVDLGNLGASVSVHPTGQSGHPFNAHYDDFIPEWVNFRYHPTLWDRTAVLADSRERLVLKPAKGQ